MDNSAAAASASSASPPPAPNSSPPRPEPSPSPSPTASSSSSPDTKPNNLELVPVASTPNSGAAATSKRTPPLPWTDQETVSLIQTYQEKWYSLKKGQLKANQWEDVANAVAARCGYDVPSKTSTQCRHKIEKLRKRYRTERLKPYPNSWHYFDLMDGMERGPMPIPARPMSAVKYQSPIHKSAGDEGEGNFVNFGGIDVNKKNKLKSVNNLLQKGDVDVGNYSNSNRNVNINVNVNRMGFSGGGFGVDENVRVIRGQRTPVIQKRKGYFQNEVSDHEDDNDDDEGEEMGGAGGAAVEEKGKGVDVGKELAAEIRGFADRFMRMETKKIEVMRENERYRMEMEKKRMDKILEAQRKVVDTIGRAFEGARKKVKLPQET